MGSATLEKRAAAHVREDGEIHLLRDHLESVGELAAVFAKKFTSAEWGRLAGRWHDLGKYAGNFQKMIHEAHGLEAHIEPQDALGPRDHSTAGALHAALELGNDGIALAFVIAGHHAGLADKGQLADRLRERKERLDAAKAGGAPVDLLSISERPPTLVVPAKSEDRRAFELWTRMLFSTLCDADFLDTESFYDKGREQLRGGYPSIASLLNGLTAHLDSLEAGAQPTEVNRVRAEVRAASRVSAKKKRGVFSLTVPTGGGKTFASLTFALEHAIQHGLERVIVGIPFTSILEQTADAYRRALPNGDGVIEHHSAIDPARETSKNRIASENWDAPIVVTTTVQLLESLFANRPSSCRKLHRLANSVIVLDEAQSLPPGLLGPILDVLSDLVRNYGVSIVISTATQPVLERGQSSPSGFAHVEEIVPPEVMAFDRLRRVRVEWPADSQPLPYDQLARAVAAERDVLCIVHRRADARELCALVDAEVGDTSTVHLSALMCPDHRAGMLADVLRRKRAGLAVRLVSTQLVEAGVDVDFPVVYRALAGADSLAQAAGRCNREGKLDDLGILRVFLAPTMPPKGVPQTGLAIVQMMLRESPLDLFSADTFRTYFSYLYGAADLDAKRIQAMRENLCFRQVATAFKLIEDDWSAPLVVRFGKASAHLDDLERFGPSRERLRALQRFTINVPKIARQAWLASGAVREIAETVAALEPNFQSAYDARFGLIPERVGRVDSNALIIDG